MRVISVVSGKGGVGKTTIVSNVGSLLTSKFKKNVIVVDCNVSTSNLGLYFGIDQPPITLNHVLKGQADIKEALYTHFSGVQVLPASLTLHDLKGLDISKLQDLIKDSYHRLAKKNDILLLDCAPGMGRESLSAVKSSQEVIFVTIPYISGLMDMVRCAQVIQDVDVKPLGLVVNMVSNYKHELSEKDIENLSGLPVLTSIALDRNVLKSHAMRVPVTLMAPGTAANKGFETLAKIIMEGKND